MYDFENKTLLLTGANGGIGRAVAGLFYAHGANLVLADLDAAGLEVFAHGLGGDVDRRVAVLRMDAANPDDAQQAVDVACARFGGIDHRSCQWVFAAALQTCGKA